jgi:hypothetical protein
MVSDTTQGCLTPIDLTNMLQDLIQHLAGAARMALSASLAVLKVLWGFARAPLIAALQVAAALIVLFEEWGWRPLMDLMGWIARFRVIAKLELWIASLPPYASLLVFVLPTTILLPLKFIAMWLLAQGQVMAAGGLFIGAKIVSTALVARIFMLTKPALMRIAWFARAYTWFIPWKDALFAQIRASWVWRYGRMVKTAIKLETKQAWTRWKPTVVAAWAAWRPQLAEVARGVRAAARQMWQRVTGA